jgi:hypothetical protein
MPAQSRSLAPVAWGVHSYESRWVKLLAEVRITPESGLIADIDGRLRSAKKPTSRRNRNAPLVTR